MTISQSGKLQAIPFVKMSGLGNDFILIDDRDGVLSGFDLSLLASKLCTPRLSIGADELMVIERPRKNGDLFMRTFNPDGSEVKMCGNASRCVARYAFSKGIASSPMLIETEGGPVSAIVENDAAKVGLQITAEPKHHEITAAGRHFSLDWIEISGAPHAVVRFERIEAAPDTLIRELGAAIRRHETFPEGTNVNFIEILDKRCFAQRTFERGVEGETLACGTGATASAIVLGLEGSIESPVSIRMKGGVLDVSFSRKGTAMSEIYLGGGTRFVAEGTIHPEAWAF
jgi:diaminopimelate epimerase